MMMEGLCPLTTAEALRRAVTVAPDIEAIVGPDGRLTYAELAAEVAQVRSALIASGVQKGDHVGICLGNGTRWLVLFLAIGSAGAVTVPVNTRFRTEELRYALGQSRVKMLFLADRVLGSDFGAMIASLAPAIATRLPDPALPDLAEIVMLDGNVPAGAVSWDSFKARATDLVEPRCTPDDVLLIQYTSGTTSFPKGVMLPHRNMLANAFVAGGRMGLRIGDRYHSARPFFHVAGTTLSILAAIQCVATLITMDRFEPGEALRLLEEERCTHVSGNDTMAVLLLNHPDRPRRKLVLRGGWAAAKPTIMRRFMHELGAREAVSTYGMSETSPNICMSCWWEAEDIRIAARMRLQPGLEVRIHDIATDADVGPGEVGEILVRGWSVMRGYFDKPEETAKTLSPDGWLSTGDLGRLGADGRLEFIARAKEIIRVGGENVAPVDVEDVLHRHPKVRQAQVVGVPDARLQEVCAAFIILNEGAEAEPAELLAWAKDQMAGFKVPRYLDFVADFESIGMTASSKIQKNQLRAHAIRHFGLAGVQTGEVTPA